MIIKFNGTLSAENQNTAKKDSFRIGKTRRPIGFPIVNNAVFSMSTNSNNEFFEIRSNIPDLPLMYKF